MTDRVDDVRRAFEAIEHQDYEPALSQATADYKHHTIPLGIEVVGPNDFRTKLVPLLEQIALVQRLEHLHESGDFVIVTVRATSNLHSAEFTIVYVLRYENDKVAEAWAISPPLEPPTA